MKTHEFARHLELLARLLRQLPNTELDPRLAPDLSGLFTTSSDLADKDGGRRIRQLPEGIVSKLTNLSPAEIEAYLSSDESGFTVTTLTELADRLKLTTSKRQSKNALVNMITRHFEAARMHSIIRAAKSEEV